MQDPKNRSRRPRPETAIDKDAGIQNNYPMRILLVDDDEYSLQSLAVVLTDLGHEPVPVTDPRKALDLALRDFFPMVITDIRMPAMDGLDLLARIKASTYANLADVVIITGHGDMETAIDALRKGAYDYLNKPINARELSAVVDRCAEHQALLFENREFKLSFERKMQEATERLQNDLERTRRNLRQFAGVGPLITVSEAMLALVKEAALYHQDPSVPVLLEGETGVGKEILARLIHYGESGTDTEIVPINCAAIPEQLFETELFGHEAGAYTGSTRKGQPGKMELAGSGTVFLDEIAEMPLTLQPKLLRVLEERTFFRVGGVKRREFHARVICAANRNLETLVENGKFRRDLFHRLKVGYLRIPPLRERPEDIPPLALHFLQREAQRKKRRFKEVHPETLRLFLDYQWPGNVRELENVIERAVLTTDNDQLLPEHVSFMQQPATPPERAPAVSPATPALDLDNLQLPEGGLDLEALTTQIIHKTLEMFSGNKSRAARYLGLSRYALHRRLQKQDI